MKRRRKVVEAHGASSHGGGHPGRVRIYANRIVRAVIKKKRQRPKRNSFNTFTKKWVEKLMYIAVIDLQLSYLLAFLGREQIAEELSRTVAIEIVGVMLGYFCKSYFETREAEKIRVREEKTAPEQPVEEMEDEDL